MSKMPPEVESQERINPIIIRRANAWKYVVFYYGSQIRSFDGMNAMAQFKSELMKWGQSSGIYKADIDQALESVTDFVEVPFETEEELNFTEAEARLDEMSAEGEAAAIAA